MTNRTNSTAQLVLPRPLGLVLALVVTIATLSGCMLLKLKNEVEYLDRSSLISGRIDNTFHNDKPIIVALMRRGEHYEYIPETYTVRYGEGDFQLMNRKGEFYLMAFEDQNEDLAFQHNEPVGWWGEPTLVNAGHGIDLTNMNIKLRSPEQAQKDLPLIYSPDLPPIKIARDTIRKGQIVSLSDPQFEPEIGSMGMWEPVNFVRSGHSGLFFLEAYSDHKVPILFVHGIGGTARGWQTIVDAIDRDSYQPWVLNYPSGSRLGLVADNTLAVINELRIEHGFDKLIVVAHSMGGLLARDIVNRDIAQGQKSSVIQLITLSTPWGGHDAAAYAKESSPIVVPAWLDMAPGSPYIESIMSAPFPKEFEFKLLFGFEGSSSMFLKGNSDGTIALRSLLTVQAQAQAQDVVGFAEDHVSIMRSKAVIDTVNHILKR